MNEVTTAYPLSVTAEKQREAFIFRTFFETLTYMLGNAQCPGATKTKVVTCVLRALSLLGVG